jgi:hypothetical protein
MSVTPRNRRTRDRARFNRRNDAKHSVRTTLGFERLENRLVRAGVDCSPLNDVSGGDPALPAFEVAPANEPKKAAQGTARSAIEFDETQAIVASHVVIENFRNQCGRTRDRGDDSETETDTPDQNTMHSTLQIKG